MKKYTLKDKDFTQSMLKLLFFFFLVFYFGALANTKQNKTKPKT